VLVISIFFPIVFFILLFLFDSAYTAPANVEGAPFIRKPPSQRGDLPMPILVDFQLRD
jgi:hypothetical protein